MNRRAFVLGLAPIATAALARSKADVLGPLPYSSASDPPMDDRAAFVSWMEFNRGEDSKFLRLRWDRCRTMVTNHRFMGDVRNRRAFLMTPREEFVTSGNLARAYEWTYLDIGHGVTIADPHTVARMTAALDVKPGEKVLEIGTGSGYQAAYLATLTDRIWTIEIIPQLAERTSRLFDSLAQRGYSEYGSIIAKSADGYFGWADASPFDKIIVTCGIDHVPPSLLQQLKPDGIMVIPVGSPRAHHVLKITKRQSDDGMLQIVRSDIYDGAALSFVPFTKMQDGIVQGTHYRR